MVALAVRRAAVIIFALVIIAVALTVFVNHRSEGSISSFHFHGNISINNTPAPAHTTILARIDEKICGATEIVAPGHYDLDIFAHPDTNKYISFWIKMPSMEYAVQADQKRTLPQTRECLFDLTFRIKDGDSDLHTGISRDTDPAVSATPCATPCANATTTPQHTHEYDPLLWDVVINEIMWDEAEYIELYSTLDRTICIGNWTITRGTGAVNDTIEITINPGAIIPAHGYYLIADKGATTCKPDQISNMTLKNGGEVLQLFNGFPPISKRIDVVNQNGNWFAGKGDDVGQSMERMLPEDGTNRDNWYTSLGYECGRIGTPGKENSMPDRTPPEITLVNDSIGVNGDIAVSFSERIDISTLLISVIDPYGGWVSGRITGDGDVRGAVFDPYDPLQVGVYNVRVKCRDPSDNLADQEFVLAVVNLDSDEPEPPPALTLTPASTATPAPTTTPTPAPDPTPVPKIVINELMPNPVGADHGNETTELYNCGDDSVDISGWILENEDGDTYTIPAGETIEAHGYYLTKKIQLDNGGGQVFLYHDGEEVDQSIAYTHSTEGKSWQRRTDGLDTDSDSDWIERDQTFGVSW